jgi:hypothetical protein
VAEESQTAGKALLAALAAGFVHATFDARHGFTHFPHASEGGAILTTGKTKTTLVNRGFARFGSHEIPFAMPCSLMVRVKRVYFNRFHFETGPPRFFKESRPRLANRRVGT